MKYDIILTSFVRRQLIGETMMVMIVVAFVVATLIGFWRVGCWYFEYHARYWLDANGSDLSYFQGMTLPERLTLRHRQAARLWRSTFSYVWAIAWTVYYLVDLRLSNGSLLEREWALWLMPMTAVVVWWLYFLCRREYRTMRSVHADYLEDVAMMARH